MDFTAVKAVADYTAGVWRGPGNWTGGQAGSLPHSEKPVLIRRESGDRTGVF
jgi:hypothetical protein